MTSMDTALATVDRERLATLTLDLSRAWGADALEGPRAEVVADYLAHPRIDVHVDPALPGRPNVIARIRGSRRDRTPGLLLNGHLDGPFHPGTWSRDAHDPWRVGDRLYGATVTDMLGGLASMVEAVRMAADADLPGDLVLLANMYHDSNGLGTKYGLASESDWPMYGINGEPTRSTIMTTHGGCVKFQVRFTGTSAHVSRTEEGRDALAAAVDVYQALRTAEWTHEPFADLPQHPRFVVGVLKAGIAAGSVADQAVLEGDMRTVPSQSWQTVRGDLERLIAGAVGPDRGVQAKIRCVVRQRAFLGPKSGTLFDSLRSAHRRVWGADPGVNEEKAAQSFVTDAVDMHYAGIETLVYGPGEWHYVPDEYVELDELARAAQVYLATAYGVMGA